MRGRWAVTQVLSRFSKSGYETQGAALFTRCNEQETFVKKKLSINESVHIRYSLLKNYLTKEKNSKRNPSN